VPRPKAKAPAVDPKVEAAGLIVQARDGDPSAIRSVLDRLKRGDESALPIFRAMLDIVPSVFDGGEMARNVERQMIEALSGGDLAAREVLGRRMAALRAELADPEPLPLERLLVERIALNWLAVHQAEMDYHHRVRAGGGGVTLAHDEYLQRIAHRAHQRYLASIMALAKVRKLGPEVLISVVQQVNVEAPKGGPSPAPLTEMLAGRSAARN
jgi:hypothetical protein